VADATEEGYFIEERLLDLESLGRDAEVTVRIEKGKVIAGRARDAAGRPLAGARVHILELYDGTERRPVEGCVETDADGRFRDDGFRRGIYRVFLTGEIDEREFAVVREGVSAGEENVLLTFEGFGRRRFTFEDEATREPLAVREITVELIFAHTGEEEQFVPWVELSDLSEVVLDALPQGHYRLRLEHPGYREVFSEIFFVKAGENLGEVCYRLVPER
jgi:hypothetical protein